ncbi:IPT/TIG domain-containing protein [Flagellimonas lutaonensis]|uniref:Kelch repeat type 1-containing protein n=1 Tax=Flagellimonas lutaonensis TaxID=516051 RepID=A0A0D5YTW3_9FLAO|nr:IPT/TIG domain-containing protein [Allomuricauda lutaonensis]AKA35334.1 Kelch repeat type 1-containing protein [Allomuricauda lutaonensis]
MKKSFLYFFCSILIFSCSEDSSEEVLPRPESEVETEESFELSNFELEIKVFEDGGVIMEASASELDSGVISEHGFLLSQLENPDFNNSQKFEPDEIVGNKFSQIVENDLDFNKEYFVLAYVKIGEEYNYTQIESFVSTGSKAPVIAQINQAHIGDTLQINGSNFTSISNRIKVLFDEEIGTVLESTDTLIKCIVPTSLKRFNPKVVVDLYQKQGAYEEFTLFKPIIENISETSVSIGDTLTVYGQHFDFENDRNAIIVDEKQAEVLFSSRDSITFVLPKSLSFSTNSFVLNSQLQDVGSGLSFTVKSPIITELPRSFRSYETIEIIGDEFSPIAEDNIVLFDDHQATVFEATKTRLKVRVPIGPYDDRNPILQIKLMDHIYQFEDNLEFVDTWLLYKELSENYFQHFISNDIAYVFIEDDVNSRFFVQRFDSDLNLLSTFYVDYPRTSIRDEYFRILYNEMTNRVFFYFIEDDEPNFYEFSLTSLEFEVRTKYPDNQSNGNAIFSIQDKLYMGFGNFTDGLNPSENPQPYAQFWQYDVTNDSWNQTANFPINYRFRSNTSTFVLNNEGYVGNGATSTGHYDFWKFSPTNDEWIRVDNFPEIKNRTASFEYNGSGYVVFGGFTSSQDDVYKYDTNLDDWLELEDVNEYFFQDYGRAPEVTTALKFSDAIYLIVNEYPSDFCFKADLNKL